MLPTRNAIVVTAAYRPSRWRVGELPILEFVLRPFGCAQGRPELVEGRQAPDFGFRYVEARRSLRRRRQDERYVPFVVSPSTFGLASSKAKTEDRLVEWRTRVMQRVLSGAILGAAIAAAVWFLGTFPLLAISETILVLAFLEYAALVERLNARVPRVASGAASMLTCAAIATTDAPVQVILMVSMVGLGAIVVGSGRAGVDALHDISAAVLPALYLGLPLGSLVAIHQAPGREAALLLLLTIVVSDTAQYYSGRVFGRRPLAPAISPKKTVEGAAGGMLFATATMTLLGAWWLPQIGMLWRAGLGVAVSMLGIVGDLFESLIKRGAGVKDASTLIPGHGGVLDRIDALLFAAPVYYVFVKYTVVSGQWSVVSGH